MKRLTHRAPLVVLIMALTTLGLVTSACDDPVPDTTAPTPTLITEPAFTGTLTPNGSVIRPFAVTTFGTVTLTLVKIDPNPDSATRIGLSLGTWNGSACQIIIDNNNAPQGFTVTGAASSAGNLCARVYDPASRITDPVDFEIKIEHF